MFLERFEAFMYKKKLQYEDIPHHGTELYLTHKDGECRSASDGYV